jgi:hypothetical protein
MDIHTRDSMAVLFLYATSNVKQRGETIEVWLNYFWASHLANTHTHTQARMQSNVPSRDPHDSVRFTVDTPSAGTRPPSTATATFRPWLLTVNAEQLLKLTRGSLLFRVKVPTAPNTLRTNLSHTHTHTHIEAGDTNALVHCYTRAHNTETPVTAALAFPAQTQA